MKTQTELTEKQEAIASLKKMGIKPGSKIYTIVRHVSSSGMSRSISAFITTKEGIQNIDWYIQRACGLKQDKNHYGLKMGGCGMDMGFAMIYNLGRVMYPEGFKLPKGKYGRNGDKSGFDKDGGYALDQNWL